MSSAWKPECLTRTSPDLANLHMTVKDNPLGTDDHSVCCCTELFFLHDFHEGLVLHISITVLCEIQVVLSIEVKRTNIFPFLFQMHGTLYYYYCNIYCNILIDQLCTELYLCHYYLFIVFCVSVSSSQHASVWLM